MTIPKLVFVATISAVMMLSDSGRAVTAARQGNAVFVAIYERGPKYQEDRSVFEQPSIKEHIAHHEALGSRLIAAGPLRTQPNDPVIGLIVFEADGDEAAQRWFRDDPAVVGGVMTGRVRQWRTSRISPRGP